MRKFEKSSKLDNVCYDVRGPVVEEANKMMAQGVDVLRLNIGNPAPFGFNAPNEVIYDMIHNLRDAQGYSDSKGIFSARKAIMQYCQLKKIEGVTLDDIYTGNGVSELISLSMQGLLNNGDEILIPSPDYPLWTAAANLAGGHPVHYICDEQSEWFPDMDDIRKKITDKTKVLILNSPCNPTGAMIPEEELWRIRDIVLKHNLTVISDQPYERLVYDGRRAVSIGALPDMDKHTMTVNTFSKTYAMSGWRVGYGTGRRAAGRHLSAGALHALSARQQFAFHAAGRDGVLRIRRILYRPPGISAKFL